MTGTSLEEIFGNSDSVEPEPTTPEPKVETLEATPETQEVVEAEPTEPITGEDPAPTEPAPDAALQEVDQGAPPAPTEATPSGHVPRAALEDERRKRQEAQTASKEYEDRIAALEKQLTAPAPAAVPQPQPQQHQVAPQQLIQPPDPWTDPEGALAHQQQVMDANMFSMKADLGRDMMRTVNSDYDEVEALFVAEAQRDPVLTVQMMQASNPAKYAYEKGRQLKLMNEIGSDPSAYEQQLRDKITAELIEAQAAATPPPQAPATPPAPPPTSLAGVPSSAPRQANKVSWEGPTPLDQILNS